MQVASSGSQARTAKWQLCRPRGRLGVSESRPQTHIVEALLDLVRTGELAPCEKYLDGIESEFAALSAAIGRPSDRRRTQTYKPQTNASQGQMLYYTWPRRSTTLLGWGAPTIVIQTVANRTLSGRPSTSLRTTTRM